MAAIGSLVFCTDCGNLLDETEGKNVLLHCDVCGAFCRDTSSKTIVTRSKPSAYPSTLRAKRSEVKQLVASEMTTQATMKETCEKCGAKEVRYSEQQLRGADEGSTIFYECDCGHKWTTNN